MADLIFRNIKGSRLTSAEGDANTRELAARAAAAQATADTAAAAAGAGLAPVALSASTALTEAAHANRQLHVTSPNPVTLDLPATAGTGKRFFGVNLGAGAITLRLNGGGPVPGNAILPATIAQFEAFEVWRHANGFVRIA